MCGNKEEMESFQCIMLDYDNYSDFDKENKNPFKHLNIKYSDYWKTLVTAAFADDHLKLFFESLKEEQRESYFTFAISCISKFVQINFTGPEISLDTEKFLASDVFKGVDYKAFLAINNEEININVKHPCLLIAAKCVFKNCKMSPLLNMWWQWRGILIHQKILDELSPTLLSNACNLQKGFQELVLVGNMKALFEIEQAQLFCRFRSIAKADKHIKAACEILGLKYELAGKLGKRTKHQEKELAQLSLDVTLDDREMVDRQLVNELVVPTYVNLNDDVRLETIKYANPDDDKKLPNTEQKLLLTVAQFMIVSKPQDDLYYEEIKPFIDLILSQNNTWCVRAVILLLRSKLEAKHNRTIERSLAQVEEIMNCASKKAEPHPLSRVGAVYSTGLHPIWKVEGQYADLMLNLGLVKGSLEIYMKLQLWEEVIVCCTILKNTHRATEIIKAQLEIKPTVKLYCLLGDTTLDVSCYEKAWEFSKRRSHRAQRHWGNHYFTRKQYEEAIPHFEKSVSINPLQGIAWLRLGFAALETQNWPVAATAYRRYTTIEPDGFEAWNNLAQAYIKLGNKRNAHQALQDALRCNFDNWKVWENFLIVSADISNYSDVIRAYHKLLDLKEKYLDVDVLKVLVYGVCNEINDSDADKATNILMRRTRELLGRITAIYPAEGALWELYASVAPVLLLKIQRLQRAYRGYTQGAWIQDVNNCKHVLYVCLKLGEAVLDDTIPPKDTVINSVRLNISAAISVIKKLDYTDTKMLLQEVTAVLARIIEKSKNAST